MAILILKALIVADGVFIGLCIYFGFVRNTWVLCARQRLLRTDPRAYDRLPSYPEMVFTPFVWNVRDFLKGRQS